MGLMGCDGLSGLLPGPGRGEWLIHSPLSFCTQEESILSFCIDSNLSTGNFMGTFFVILGGVALFGLGFAMSEVMNGYDDAVCQHDWHCTKCGKVKRRYP